MIDKDSLTALAVVAAVASSSIVNGDVAEVIPTEVLSIFSIRSNTFFCTISGL